jgi:hypothetical protein
MEAWRRRSPESAPAIRDRGRQIRYRIIQFTRQIAPRRMEPIDAALRSELQPAEWELVARLIAGDRAHLFDTWRRLNETGCRDPDVLKAALLHDIGKVDDRGRVYLAHRVLAVLLRRFAPRVLERLAGNGSPGWRYGFYLAIEHPRTGAELARLAGSSPRVCWLIAHHQDHGANGDEGLALLQSVDEEG